MTATRPVVRRSGWIIASVVLATFGYLLAAEFTWWDDASTVHQNPLLNPATRDSLVYFWTTPQHAIFIPLTYTIWFLLSFPARVAPDALGIALNPAWFHATNIAFHMLSALAVAGILRRIFRTEWAAVLGAIAFAVHPVQVESVAWVSGLKDVMSGCFVLWAIYWFVRAREAQGRLPQPCTHARAPEPSPQPTKSPTPVTPVFLVIVSVAMLVLALLSKPSAMTAPALILVIDVLLLHTPWKQAVRSVLPYAVVVIPFMIIAKLSQPALSVDSPLWARPLIAMDSVSFYLGKLVFPHPLTLDYGRTPTRVIETGQIYWTWIVALAAAGIGAWMLRKRWYAPACGLAAIALAPAHTLGLVRFEFQDVSTVADHYLYVALLGVAIVLAWAVAAIPAMRYVAIVLLGFWCGGSVWQTRHWQDHKTLMLHTYEQTPFGKVGATNLTSWGIITRDLPMAKHFSDIALQNRPDEPVVLMNAAYVALIERNDARAKEMFLRYVGAHERFYGAQSPRVAEAWVKAGQAYLDTKRLTEARWCVENAQRLAPFSPDVQALDRAVKQALRAEALNETE
jgi:protein O-mannosyl-transferase